MAEDCVLLGGVGRPEDWALLGGVGWPEDWAGPENRNQERGDIRGM